MEMSIDEAIEIISDIDKAYRTFSNMEYKAMQKSIDVMRKYQQLQATYENRLKSDMMAGLEDLDLLIDEFDSGCGWDGYIKKIDVHKLIQQKINALKGVGED